MAAGDAGSSFVRVASLADVPPGAMLDVDVADQVVLLVNLEGVIHAVSAWCPHQGTALALGRLTGSTITCFAHLWTFDVATGEPIWPPMARVARGYRLRTYPVRVENGGIFVSLP
jgi:nitrite reductase/ring-hydroxylating ferredoxin subunit